MYRAQVLLAPATTAATAKKTSAMPTQASSEAKIVRVSVYNMVLSGFAMVLSAYVL
jgi:hypothetical protein